MRKKKNHQDKISNLWNRTTVMVRQYKNALEVDKIFFNFYFLSEK